MASNIKFCLSQRSICLILSEELIWKQKICRIWLPTKNVILRVPKSDLEPLNTEKLSLGESNKISYIATAAKIAELLENTSKDNDSTVLLAPMESNVIPLPHQLHALSRAISGDRIRYLLADEVGLG